MINKINLMLIWPFTVEYHVKQFIGLVDQYFAG